MTRRLVDVVSEASFILPSLDPTHISIPAMHKTSTSLIFQHIHSRWRCLLSKVIVGGYFSGWIRRARSSTNFEFVRMAPMHFSLLAMVTLLTSAVRSKKILMRTQEY